MDELSAKLGPEYIALMGELQDMDPGSDVGPPHLEKRIGGLAKGNDGHSGAQAGTTAP
jgi:hypothetical protein